MSDPRYGDAADSLALTCLSLLERLRPIERSVFLLHDVFGRSHAETARIVGVPELTCRQLLLDVRGTMRRGRGGIDAERRENAEVATRLYTAVRTGDTERLGRLLAPDAIAWTSSEPDATKPVVGRDAVAARLVLQGADRILSVEVVGRLVQTVRLE
jgi:Sigma-70, region 4/Domain of unknown function (DUF4440)